MVIKEIIYMVLSLIVLVVIIGVPLYDYANTNFFGGKGVKRWITDKPTPFTPYQGEMDLEQRKVFESLSALVCATNVVAEFAEKKVFSYAEKNCPGAVEIKTCPGVSYGSSCVICEKKDKELNCDVKNFELPQKLSAGEDDGVVIKGLKTAGKILAPITWVSAYGDPNYVVYYEAFPPGEEEAWVLDPKEVSLLTIATWDILLPVGGAVAGKTIKGMTKGAELLANSKLAKGATAMSKFGGIYYLYAAGKIVTKTIANQAAKLGTLLKAGVTYAKDATGKLVMKSMSPELYIKIFSNGESVLKYAKPEDIKKMFSQMDLDTLANAIRKGDNELVEIAELIVKDDKVALTSTTFLEKLTDVSANLRPFAEKSALNLFVLSGSIALAKEDSMNDKFAPIGVNAIGFKKPYNEVLVTSQTLPGLNEDVNKYYLALNKESYLRQRFFLASPCKTNLRISVQNCLCGKNDAVGIINISGKEFLANKVSFEGNTYDFAVKECAARSRTGMESQEMFDQKFKVIDCISIEPQDVEGFCYSGNHFLANTAAWTFYGTSFVTGVGAQALKATVLGAGVVGAGETFGASLLAGWAASAGIGAIQTVFDYSLGILENWATSYTKWPNH